MGRRVHLSALVILPLACLSAGCVYVPWFEQTDLYGAKRDFRDLSGTRPADPLVDGRMTRAQATELLGPAPYASANGRVVAYQLLSRHGVWYHLLFLETTPGGQRFHALALRFGPDGVLQRHRFVTVEAPTAFQSVFGYVSPFEGLDHARSAALDQIWAAEDVHLMNRHGDVVTGPLREEARRKRLDAFRSRQATTRP